MQYEIIHLRTNEVLAQASDIKTARTIQWALGHKARVFGAYGIVPIKQAA